MPDPNLSAAIRQAYAIAPVTSVIYHTLELYHPSFGANPIRVVRGKQAIDAKLEVAAPRNPGAVVTFTAIAFEIIPPDQSTSQMPTCTLQMDNVDRVIGASLDTAILSGGTTPITCIYRAFLSDALATAGPDSVCEMTVFGVNLDAFKVTAVMGFVDLLNRQFPFEEYTLARFPGLAHQT